MAADPSPPKRPRLGRNVVALAAVSFLTDVSSDMTYPLLPMFLATVLGASATSVGAIEGAAETTAALLKLASGWWSDRVSRRKPLVLAIPPTDRWPLPGMPTGDGGRGGVTISPDGSHLTMSFIGAAPGTGACEAEYTADIAQSATAVSISTRELPGHGKGQEGGNYQEICDLVGYNRTVTVTLQSPLGNRVVVDSRGVPLPAG